MCSNDLEIKQFKTTKYLTKLRILAKDKWKELSKMICNIAWGKHCRPDMLYDNNNNNVWVTSLIGL